MVQQGSNIRMQMLNMAWPGKASAGEPDWLTQANKI